VRKCYTAVNIQEMKLKVLENKGAETTTQNNITQVVPIIINSIMRRFYWPNSQTISSTRTR